MASTPSAGAYGNLICKSSVVPVMGLSLFPLKVPRSKPENSSSPILLRVGNSTVRKSRSDLGSKKLKRLVPKCSSDSNGSKDESSDKDKIPFGYTRKDVLLIGVGLTAAGYGLKSGLEFFGVDSLQAGNVVQLVLVLGLTVGWISTYVFRVSNTEMTYAQQLRDYESKVMEKRLESLTEAELQALLEQVEEEKQRLAKGKQV